MPVITISDAEDPRIAPYRNVRERDLVGREDRFIAEGKVTLDVLLSHSPHTLESVLIGENRLDPLSDLLAQLPDGVPVYAASKPVLDAIVGFHLHRGVLALGRRQRRKPVNDLITESHAPPTLLALIGLSNHDNVGACFRNAAALGAGAVLLDPECADPLYRKAIRVSAGTSLWMPTGYGTSATDLISAVTAAGYTPLALTPSANAPSLYDLDLPDRLCLLVGAEGPGLPEYILDGCKTARLPMANAVDSLNVATSAAIALSWIQQSRQA